MSHRQTIEQVTERFWDKVQKKPSNGCWLWTAGCFPSGYWAFTVYGKTLRAHRFAYELSVGPISTELSSIIFAV